jgi:hypothetical protein
MALNVSLVILPDWLEKALASNNQTLDSALDLLSLSRILSLGDVSFYASINQHLFSKIPLALQGTFRSFPLVSNEAKKYVKNDHNGDRPSDKEVEAFLNSMSRRVFEQGSIDFADSTSQKLLATLPYTHQHVEEGVLNKPEFVFDVAAIKEDVYGVRFTLRDRSRSYVEQLVDCYDRLLKLLIGQHGFVPVAGTKAFEEYVRLQRSTNTVY